MEVKTKILTYLQQANEPLSYYQLDQKFARDDYHDLLAQLTDALAELESEGFVQSKMFDVVKHYFLTDQGKAQVPAA